MSRILKNLREIGRYPAALIGLIFIGLMILVSILTMVVIPYDEAIRLWRGGEDVWYTSPKTAAPKWVNWFRNEKLPETLVIDSTSDAVTKTYEVIGEDTTEISWAYSFDFEYDSFPDDLSLFFNAKFEEKLPHVELTWIKPDGEEVRIGTTSV